MKASELRIGNLFNPERPTAVEAWMLLPESKINFKPIPVTEEWLEKLGFEKKTERDFLSPYKPHSYTYDVEMKGVYIGNEDDFEFFSNMDIDYVHQLQNLYFALTGEELTIKELV